MNIVTQLEHSLDLKLFRKGFLMLSLCLIPLAILDGLWTSLKVIQLASDPATSLETANKIKTSEPLSFYESVFDRDTVFGKVAATPGAIVSKTPIAELAKDFRLKGVVLAGEPEAIMEDARTQKTSFVKVGGRVGEMTVKQIKEGQVLLISGEEEITLEIQ